MPVITEALAAKVLEVVDAGLVRGVGKPIPGQMCVEAAVCFALGEPHGDQPSCVGVAVRAFKIRLNDARWSSNEARAKGLRELAVAQLGSDTIDQQQFVKLLVIEVVRTFLPLLLRARKFEVEAEACEQVKTLEQARVAAGKVKKSIYDAADAFAAFAAYAAYAAADASAAYAAAFAAYAAYAAADAGDALLLQMAAIGVRVLKQLRSPGVRWLTLAIAHE